MNVEEEYELEIEAEDKEAIAELFSDNGRFSYNIILHADGSKECLVLDDAIEENLPLQLRGGIAIDFPNVRHEVCRGSCDLSETELDSILKPKRKKTEMESRILSLLGLGNDASESEVYQAVKDLKDRLAAADSKLIQIEADEFVAQNKERICDAEEFKRLYIKYGKDVAEGFLKVFTSSAQQEATCGTPES